MKKELVQNVLEVKRVSKRITNLKLEMETVMDRFGIQDKNTDGGRLCKKDGNGCSEYFLPNETRT